MKSSNFKIFNASAGSGKTFTITVEYICILLTHNDFYAFQNILAITFTNKAAAEMKQRIVNSLVGFAYMDTTNSDDDLLQKVILKTKLTTVEIKKRSYHLLKKMITNYASFEVSTIDSFNHRIIRTFAKDLSIDQNFEVELDAGPYIQEATESLIEEVGKDSDLTNWLIDYMHYKINNDKSPNIRTDLINYAQLVLHEKNEKGLQSLENLSINQLKKIKSKLIDKIDDTKKELKSIAEEFFLLIEKNKVKESDFFRKLIPQYFHKLIHGDVPDKFASKWHDITQTSFYSQKIDKTTANNIDAIRPIIEQMFIKSQTVSIQYNLSKRIQKSFVPLGMINEVTKRLNKIKEERGVLFINDFNQIIRQHIKEQPAIFIYERLGEKFQYYFIDEFQDTSKLQWENIVPLIENAITSQDEYAKSGQLYIVGDVKQSIYEWRGGYPEQFFNLTQDKNNPFNIQPEVHTLQDNWRSSKAIVDFNNEFFYFAKDFFSGNIQKEYYTNVRQNVQKDIDGCVDIHFLPDLDNELEMLQQRTKVLQSIILKLDKKGYNRNDICILVRKNKYGKAIAEAFNTLEKPISVVSQESLLISSDIKVEILYQFFNLLENYNEESSIDFLIMWLNYQKIDSSKYHYYLKKVKETTQVEYLQKLIRFNIDFNITTYNILSLYDKAEYCLRALGLHKNANAYLQFFLDEINDFSKKAMQDMGQFLEYWAENKDKKSISTAMQYNAVNIMTIHKSKGLQFPVVIYAHANFVLSDLGSTTEGWINVNQNQHGLQQIYTNISSNLVHLGKSYEDTYLNHLKKSELDKMNIAYVCMTRAEKELYILCEPLKSNKPSFKDILISYLQSIDKYQENQNRYIFRYSSLKPKSDKSKYPEIDFSTFKSYPTTPYYNTLINNKTSRIPLSKAIEYGQNIHDNLQSIVYHTDIKDKKFENDEYEIVNKIVHHQDIINYYKKPWKIYNEKEIIFEGKIVRPDRICLHHKIAVLIDYKTGREKESHEKQMHIYKDALQSLGYEVKESILIYIRKEIYIKKL